jgi:thiol-disulfide isomerase/thioredoxin
MKIRSTILSLAAIYCFFISCSDNKKPTKEYLKSNSITLIFKDVPTKWRVHRKAGGYVPEWCEIAYIDDNYIPRTFIPDAELEYDTMSIRTRRKFVEFRHSYKGVDKLSYIFQPGDTVLFTYQDKTPIASLINRKAKSHDVNLALFKKETLYPNDYPSFVKYRNPILFMERTNDLAQAWDNVVTSANENFINEIGSEKRLIDSLYQNDLISVENYSFLTTQIIYQKKIIELYNLIGGPRRSNTLLPNLTSKDFEILPELDIEMGYVDHVNILDSQNDSLLHYGFYQDIINWINLYYLSRKVGSVNSTNYVDGVATAGGSNPDYLALYDTINNCDILSKQAANVLKLKTIQKIVENNTIDEAHSAFEKFKKDVIDTTLINFVRNKYSFPKDTTSFSFDLQLTSMNGNSLCYDELIEKQKGKVIYIDFWSSTCRPCIEQLKFAEKLKELYEGKNLVQIRISIEPNKDSWQKACKKYNLLTESYVADNIFTSRQLEKMRIKYVPHYYLYDIDGNMVDDFAPRPSDKKLLELIDKYLYN